MAHGFGASILFSLLSATTVMADYSEFAWSNAATQKCPGMFYTCVPPQICSYDPTMQIYYCCVPGDKNQVCHTAAPTCLGDGKKQPSSSQVSCGSGNNAYCCYEGSQICTQAKNQINICWSTSTNPVAMFDAQAMNKTYQSLEATQPSATNYSIAYSDLQKMTSTVLTSSSTPLSSSTKPSDAATTISSAPSVATMAASASFSTSASPKTEPKKTIQDDSLSGGAIGGIVGGVVGGIALLGGLAFFLWRRRRRNSVVSHQDSEPPIAEMHSEGAPYEKYTYVAEASGQQAPIEMPTNTYQELSGDSERQHH
ncbi:hypothetical protein ACEQ8H_000118 [Pleosporales sp. CAS-2024a]